MLACVLALPSVALATSGKAPASAPARVIARGSATGTITFVGWSSFTIQTAGPKTGVVNALTTAANRITKDDYPYVYGGGHAQAGIASIGIKGPGYNGHTVGFDCSGSVAAVLAGAGLWAGGSGVPNDAGIIAELLPEKLIARGAGTGPVEVTLYDDPGVHIFMNIDGRFFGTSDGGGGGDRRGGAGWLDDGAPDASSSIYKRYHFVPSALRGSTSAGHIVSFQVGELQSSLGGLQTGEKVGISYEQMSTGALIATAISYPGAITTTGTVSAIAANDSSFTIETTSGTSVTFSTGTATALLDGVADGDTVQVTYTKSGSTLTARAVTVTATPPVSAPSADGSGGDSGGGYGGGYPGGGYPGGGDGAGN